MNEPDGIIIDDAEVVAMADALAKLLHCSPEEAVYDALLARARAIGLHVDDQVT